MQFILAVVWWLNWLILCLLASILASTSDSASHLRPEKTMEASHCFPMYKQGAVLEVEQQGCWRCRRLANCLCHKASSVFVSTTEYIYGNLLINKGGMFGFLILAYHLRWAIPLVWHVLIAFLLAESQSGTDHCRPRGSAGGRGIPGKCRSRRSGWSSSDL